MAIPTQFSVAKTRKCPIANPTQSVDGVNPLTAEDVGFISGASTLPAKASVDIGAPSELSAENESVIDNAVVIVSKNQADINAPSDLSAKTANEIDSPSELVALNPANINNPVSLSAQTAEAVDNASLFSALSVGTINNPSIIVAESVAPVDNASIIGAKSEHDISAPIALTPNPATPTSGTFPLNHARILYRNTLRINQGITTNNGLGGADTLKPNTWESWAFTNGGEIIFTLTDARLLDTVCIGAHNIGSLGAVVGVEHSATDSGDDFVATFPGQNPPTDAAIMFHRLSKVNVRRLKITISGTGDFEIGYISAGAALQMQRPFFNGHQPYTDSDVTEYYSNRTESGEIIGRQIRRRGFETTYEWQNIDDGWYRENIPAFKEAAKTFPFFIAWNLLEYPEDVAFGETTGDIATSMQNGTRTKRSGLSFTVRGV